MLEDSKARKDDRTRLAVLQLLMRLLGFDDVSKQEVTAARKVVFEIAQPETGPFSAEEPLAIGQDGVPTDGTDNESYQYRALPKPPDAIDATIIEPQP